MEDVALVFVILVALGFDFVNGFHDAANSIATVVSTRVLSPRLAVMWAAAFNFIAFLFFGTHVASTIAKDVVVQDVLTIGVIFAGLDRRHRVGPHHLLPRACRPARPTPWWAAWPAPRWPRPASTCSCRRASARSGCSSCCRR